MMRKYADEAGSMKNIDSFERIYGRILDATQARTQVELAACLGIAQSSVSDVLRRQRIPSIWYLKLLDRFEISPDWLRWGAPPVHWWRKEGETLVGEEGAAPNVGDLSGSPVWTALYASDCGGVAEPDKDALVRVGSLALPYAFAPKDTLVVRLESEAGVPSIHKGSLVGVDMADATPRSGELYALLLPYEGFGLRRIFFEAPGPIMVLKAGNPDFPVVRITAEEGAARILGRVWWVWQPL